MLADLAQERYRDLLVVENPATSSPGLAFLLATVAASGQDGFAEYWQRLRANGVEVENSWDNWGSYDWGTSFTFTGGW